MKNKLIDLNDHLFAQIERLGDEGLKGDDLKNEIGRSKAITDVASKIEGQVPQNHKPIGHERVCAKDGYVLVKTAEPNKFEMKHKVEWAKVHGEVPKGMCLLFKDGNKTNCSADNLMLIDRSTLVRLNQFCAINKIDYYEIDQEMREAVIAIATLKSKMFNLAKKHKL